MTRGRRWVIVLAVGGMAGLLLLIAADRFGRPELIGPGLLLFAAGTFAAGIEIITSRYTYERNRAGWISDVFTGSAARLIGLALVILAAGIAAAGLSFVLGRQEELYVFALARPGIALVPLGVLMGAFGAARVIGAREWRGSLWRLLASLPHRIGGALLLLAGLVAVCVGLAELVAPEAFDEAVDRVLTAARAGPP